MNYKFVDIGCAYFSVSTDIFGTECNGLLIEPIEEYINVLPTGENIRKECCAISTFDGEMEMNVVVRKKDLRYLPINEVVKYFTDFQYMKRNDFHTDDGSSSFTDPIYILDKEKLEKRKVICSTLKTVFVKHDVTEIDYLKIDVEGYENIVLSQLIELLDNGKLRISKEIKFEYNKLSDLKELDQLSDLICQKHGFTKQFKKTNFMDEDMVLSKIEKTIISKNNEFKVHSQSGEDGIIEHIFNNIGTTNKIAVEIGVTAGGETNTQNLSENGFQLYWLDCLYRKDLPKLCTFHQEFITKDNIIGIFQKLNIPIEFDLLSIDIDGNDYHIREKLKDYNPRVIIMEYNGIHKPNEDYIMPYNENYEWKYPSPIFGASLSSLTKQANKLGYDLVYCTQNGVNSFFIRKDINPFDALMPKDAWNELEWWKDLKNN